MDSNTSKPMPVLKSLLHVALDVAVTVSVIFPLLILRSTLIILDAAYKEATDNLRMIFIGAGILGSADEKDHITTEWTAKVAGKAQAKENCQGDVHQTELTQSASDPINNIDSDDRSCSLSNLGPASASFTDDVFMLVPVLDSVRTSFDHAASSFGETNMDLVELIGADGFETENKGTLPEGPTDSAAGEGLLNTLVASAELAHRPRSDTAASEAVSSETTSNEGSDLSSDEQEDRESPYYLEREKYAYYWCPQPQVCEHLELLDEYCYDCIAGNCPHKKSYEEEDCAHCRRRFVTLNDGTKKQIPCL